MNRYALCQKQQADVKPPSGIVEMDSLEIVVLDKLLELLDVADGQQVLLDVWQVHQVI